MPYYRIAAQIPPAPLWRWETTWMTSLEQVITFLVVYRCPASVCLRIFAAASPEALEGHLARANQGDLSGSWTDEQFLRDQSLEAVERAWRAAAGELAEGEPSQLVSPAGSAHVRV